MAEQTATTILRRIREHTEAVGRLGEAHRSDIAAAARLLIDCLAGGGRIYVCGNGGSAADAQHIAGEMVGRFLKERRALPCVALSTDTSVLTCIGNDYGYDAVFERQVRGLGRAGDGLVLISTSGNSANLLRAAEAARGLGIATIGLLGRNGGKLLPLCDDAVIIASATTARIQEVHIFVGHCWCSLIERGLDLA